MARSLVIPAEALEDLVAALRGRGYRVVAPTVRDGAIVHARIESAAELPAGWTDEQQPASYRLVRRDDDAVFRWASGPQSWKRELFPPRARLLHASRDGAYEADVPEPEPTAFFGVRPCELAAIAIQDRVFLGGRFQDADYAARRSGVFVVTVNCGDPAPTCFCTSMGTGPRAEAGYDLALTELTDGAHRFLVETGSDAGEDVLAELAGSEPETADLEAAVAVIDRARAHMGKGIDAAGAHDTLLANLDSPAFDDVAKRCLSCGNCTLVCPTCFCTTVEDTSDLAGETAERHRVWDSCFSLQYAEMHGGNTRPSPKARYRQWLVHKLATWEDQFGVSGCVGCGRCITWCPVGIDIRDELAAVAAEEVDYANA